MLQQVALVTAQQALVCCFLVCIFVINTELVTNMCLCLCEWQIQHRASYRALQNEVRSAVRRADIVTAERDYAVASQQALTVTTAEWAHRDQSLLAFVDEELKPIWRGSRDRGDAPEDGASSVSSRGESTGSGSGSGDSQRLTIDRLSHALARARLVQEQLTQHVQQLTARVALTQVP